MENLATRIQALRIKKFGKRGKSAFAKAVGVSGKAVDFWESGSHPRPEVLQKIAKALGVSDRFLLFGSEEPADIVRRKKAGLPPPLPNEFEALTSEQRLDMMDKLVVQMRRDIEEKRGAGSGDSLPGLSTIKFVSPDEESEFVRLPLLDDLIAAGEPRDVQDKHIEGYAVTHRNWCEHPDESFFIRVKGDSMEPTIPNGAFVCIDAAAREIGELLGRVVVLFIKDAGATIKRLERGDRKGELVGIPDHLTETNRPITVRLAEGDRIIGLVRSVHAEVK